MLLFIARAVLNELPQEKGFFERNIKRMLALYRESPHLEFVPQPVAQTAANLAVPQPVVLFPAELWALPWRHYTERMDGRQLRNHLRAVWVLTAIS